MTDSVGEPIIAFVALVKNNPKRFKANYYHYRDGIGYGLKDLVTGEHFWYDSRCTQGREGFYEKYIGIPSFVTQSEWTYIHEEFQYLRKDRPNRKKEILAIRQKRNADKERQKYMDVYCSK